MSHLRGFVLRCLSVVADRLLAAGARVLLLHDTLNRTPAPSPPLLETIMVRLAAETPDYVPTAQDRVMAQLCEVHGVPLILVPGTELATALPSGRQRPS